MTSEIESRHKQELEEVERKEQQGEEDATQVGSKASCNQYFFKACDALKAAPVKKGLPSFPKVVHSNRHAHAQKNTDT